MTMQFLEQIAEEVRVAKESIGALKQRVAELEAQLATCEAQSASLQQQLADCLANTPEPEPEPSAAGGIRLGTAIKWQAGADPLKGNLIFEPGIDIPVEG